MVGDPDTGPTRPAGPVEAVAASGAQREFEEALLGGRRRYNRRQVAEAAGVSQDRAHRLWMAMGFASVGDEEAVFTDGDVDALRTWKVLLEVGAFDPSTEVAAARTIGQTVSRLAEWQVQEVMARVHEVDGTEEDATQLAGVLLPVVEGLQSYVWRRHLAAAAGRLLSGSAAEMSVQTMVVGFADIVGYTATTRHADSDELSTLLEGFEENAAEVIAEFRGRVVKTVGDEVLFVADTAHEAAEIALRLADPARTEDDLPTLRTGLAMGPVLHRFGDVYGSVVNVAARLTALARPGTVLVDRAVAQALDEDARYRLKPRRPTAVRGFHRLRSWSLRHNDN
ncbi:MAG TPA: adenylate/guanylate cyclase domain-containing protein [Pseudonocardiaceae bacterium]|jgi:adenylate cyclase|nr:adenylate/guanylate cyclase domain-containing protein [Pseudonocardiaceae bacterium]